MTLELEPEEDQPPTRFLTGTKKRRERVDRRFHLGTDKDSEALEVRPKFPQVLERGRLQSEILSPVCRRKDRAKTFFPMTHASSQLSRTLNELERISRRLKGEVSTASQREVQLRRKSFLPNEPSKSFIINVNISNSYERDSSWSYCSMGRPPLWLSPTYEVKRSRPDELN